MKTLAERPRIEITLDEDGESIRIEQENESDEVDCIIIPICDIPLFIEKLKAEAGLK
ncbi:MAG TPA: hypothetical protein PKO06_15165 [Candidatus Ozemobacteraceae bacterium]|nr:hypothetical protein [Candidatus Ozemobacteraceae bacterium]